MLVGTHTDSVVGRVTFLGSVIPIPPSELILLTVKVITLPTHPGSLLSIVIKLGHTRASSAFHIDHKLHKGETELA